MKFIHPDCVKNPESTPMIVRIDGYWMSAESAKKEFGKTDAYIASLPHYHGIVKAP